MSRDRADDLFFSTADVPPSRGAREHVLLESIRVLLMEILGQLHKAAGGAGGNVARASVTRAMKSTDTTTKAKCETTFAQAQPFTAIGFIDTPGVAAQMTVEWRLAGNTMSRTVDVPSSASVTGVAETVSVTIADVTTLGHYFEAPIAYNATIFIAPGTRPDSAVPPVQTAKVAANVNAAATSDVTVPSGATGVYVFGESGGSPAQLYVDQYTAGTIGGTAVKILGAAVNAAQPTPIPLIAGTSQIRVTNEGASQASVTIVWTMDG